MLVVPLVRLRSLGTWLLPGMLLLWLMGCSDSASVTATRSLRGASDLTALCAAYGPDGNLVGRPLGSCPDTDPDDGEVRRLFSLVTQKETGEVALIDMGGCGDAVQCRANVLDLEVTQPGTNFLPVGAEPVAIASTPGGVASFVAVAEPGREGIFGLPTSCIGPRPIDAVFRDLRSWPACRLPVAPSLMTVLTDAGRTGTCAGDEPPSSAGNVECPADLASELGPPGRRKLAVALPSLGQIVIIDAQTLLDLPQGSFEACPIENVLQLEVDRPAETPPQALPDDLRGAPDSCLPTGFPHPTEAGTFSPNPSDFALRGDTLYVSDYGAPVIHVLDVSDPCGIVQQPPLLPHSFLDPARVVTTRKVAVSPLTPSGKQYVYAIDDSAGSAGSVMIFDVSRESGQRLPLVRPRSSVIWTEPPDRIQFDQEASDIEFAVQDFPEANSRTGVALAGVQCEPSPERSSSQGASYRPDPEEGLGANPRKLRGAFGFVLLHSGFIVTVDIEDLDAPCRRPASVNSSSDVDEFGCSNDPYDDVLSEGGIATVSNEFSCNIGEAHRARPGQFYFAETGGSAPALRAFPQLRDKNGTSLAVDQSESGRGHPRLLAVNRQPAGANGGDARVFIGATLYEDRVDAANPLIVDPAFSERNSVMLPYEEPRAYSGDLGFTVSYEGPLRAPLDGLFRLATVAELGLPDEDASRLPRARYAVLQRGPNATFCEAGVEDDLVIRDRAAALLPAASATELDQFARQYADYAELSSELLPEDDEYWKTNPGRSCGANVVDRSDGATGHFLCELVFGSERVPNATREFRIARAFNDRLVVEPRRFRSESERDNILELAACCFPQNTDFRLRVSQQWVVRMGGRAAHDIAADRDTFACNRDCNPLVAGRDARVFEIACDGESDCRVDDATPRVIGPPAFAGDERSLGDSMVCVLDGHPSGGVQPGAPGSECFYQATTARFAIYRGLLPSERDMQFSWRVLGGFSPLSVDLLRLNSSRTSTSPEKMTYLPEVNQLLVADGGSTGFSFVGLRAANGGPGFSGTVAF